ncbi:MAG TPA: CopD family protein, partial [Actinomycetota bacterium]
GQWAHFAAAGVWLGGLAALLLGVRGAPSAVKSAAVRRFSAVALAALAVVAGTGVLRAVDELGSWRELGSTGYGRAVVLKVLLLAAIIGLGALHRRRSLPAAARDLGPLRRISQGELLLAAAALAVAAVLGSIPPPAAGQGTLPPGIEASGAADGVRVELSAASASPGANAFTVRLEGGGGPVRLRFRPLDDPGEAETTLALRREGGSFTGTGDNLAFDGRWRVTVEAGPARVPLEVEVQTPPQRLSVERIPGQAPKYTVKVDLRNLMRFSPQPERPGRSLVTVTSYDEIEDEQPLASLVVTHAAGDGPARQVPVRRVGPGRFVAEVELVAGRNTLTGIARKPDGARLRASAGLDVPG